VTGEIVGWALNMEAPDRPLEIEVLLAGHPVGTAVTTFHRPDIPLRVDDGPIAGFRFPRDGDQIAFPLLPELLQCRIAGTNLFLAGNAVHPRGLLARLLRELDGLHARATTSFGAGLTSPPLTIGEIAEAGQLAPGLWWVTGWMPADHPVAFPAVVTGPERAAAGVVLLPTEGSDSMAERVGIFGIIRTDLFCVPETLAERAGLIASCNGELMFGVTPGLLPGAPGAGQVAFARLRRELRGDWVRAAMLLMIAADTAISPVPHDAMTERLSMTMTTAADDIERIYAERGGRQIPAPPDFDEAAYLAENPDVDEAVAAGGIANAFEHYIRWGRAEGRRRPTRIR
jgi:hypothetical protein